jgi:hypothetical protein
MKWSIGALGVAVVVALVASGCVSGPLPDTPPDPSLAGHGYEQHEFFLDGVAHAYAPVGTLGEDGRWTAHPVPASAATFRTRLLVRRPIDPRHFSGTVLVEWMNVSAGSDIDPTYGALNAALLRHGDAFVGVSAQKVGIDALRNANPARYGTLHTPGDDYSYDIFSQAAAAVRGAIGVAPLQGLHPIRVLATGESQSAFRMVTYINAIEPSTHAYDGFLVYSRGGGAASLSAGTTMPSPVLFRTDQHVPVIDVQTETDVVGLGSAKARQPDNPWFRLWEVAGGAHADEHTLARTFPSPPTAAGAFCTYRINSANTWAVVSAGLSWLDRWVRGAATVPHAPRITLGPDPTAADPVVRDSFGNARGGIRLPELEAPTARIDGLANPPSPTSPAIFKTFCFLFGRTLPFTATQIAQLYPTHDDYVDAYDRATDRAVGAGFVLPTDGAALKAAAAAAPVPG